MQRDILWTLEEAGEENISTVLNTLRSSQRWRAYEGLISQVEAAISGLVEHGLVDLRDHWDASPLPSNKLDIAKAGTQIYLQLTDAGQKALTT